MGRFVQIQKEVIAIDLCLAGTEGGTTSRIRHSSIVTDGRSLSSCIVMMVLRMSTSIYAETGLGSGRERKCIRILELSSNEANDLEGSLKVAFLEHSPSFFALSYVWGHFSSPVHRIRCRVANSTLYEYIPITDNCHDALVQIRNSYGRGWNASSKIRIWVDAICINQHDDDEKAHQIPFMEEIYGSANQVFIWLGKGNESSDIGMHYISTASLGQSSPLLGARWKSFPRSMYPSEGWRLIRHAPDIVRRGQSLSML